MKAFTTDDEEEIRSCLKQLRDTDGETGFMHNKYPIVLTVVNNRELTLLNNYVYQLIVMHL